MYLVSSMLEARRGEGGGGGAEDWLGFLCLTHSFGFQKILYDNDFPSSLSLTLK